MINQRIGIVLESLGLGIKEGIKTASGLGFKGLQLNAAQGDIAPDNLSQTGRQELTRTININRLSICALGGELGAGFINENEFDFQIKNIKKIINLALDLQSSIITIQIGDIPNDLESSHGQAVCAALNEIGRHAESFGRRLAAKVRFDDSSTLLNFLLSLETQSVRLIYDPASLMINKIDPVDAVNELYQCIEYTSLWDTRQTEEGQHIEVPIGEGIIPFQEIISTLDSIGYYGFYVINSKGENIKKGKEFLEKY